MDQAYVAVFCPSCGIHLNDLDTQDSPDYEPGSTGRPVRLGSTYTCGWCGRRTCDWNHVAECRATWPERQVLAARQLATDRTEVRQRLNRMVSDLEAGEGRAECSQTT